MGDVQNSEMPSAKQVPAGYMPYICSELSEEQIEYAKMCLKETEETRNKYLRRIRRYIKDECDGLSDLDDDFILACLRARRYKFKEACVLLRKAFEFLEENFDYINKIDTETMDRVISSKAVGFLPYRDAKGRALLLTIAENWDPCDLKAEEMLFGTLMALYTAVENPVNQICGCVVIADCKGASFGQFSEVISWIRLLINGLQHCCPILVKEVHIIHTPSVVLWGWSIVKPFLDEKIQKIITFYDSETWESLHDNIPPCILPEELNGHLGPFSNDHWSPDIPMIRKAFFDRLYKVLDKPTTTESN